MKTLSIKINDLTENKKKLLFNYIEEYNNLCNYFIELLWNNKNKLMLKEKEQRNYIRTNFISKEIKSKYHSHFIQESMKSVVSLIKNKDIINKPVINGNILNITTILGNIKTIEDSKFKNWFNVSYKLNDIKKIIRIPLSKHFNLHEVIRNTYQLQRKDNDLYLNVFIKNIPKKIQENNNKNVLGIDLGVNDLIACSNDNFYGKDFGKNLSKYSEMLNNKGKKRNKIYQVAQKNKVKNPGKYLKIQKFNLGNKNINHQKLIVKNKLKRTINISINNLLKDNELKILVMEFLNFKGKRKINSKYKYIDHNKLNRKLSLWMIGYIKNQIERKTKDNGVILAKVNARGTSTTCSHCGYNHKNNRIFKHFKCLKCGFECDADSNGSYNVENRLFTDQPRLQKLAKIFFNTSQSENELLKLNWMGNFIH